MPGVTVPVVAEMLDPPLLSTFVMDRSACGAVIRSTSVAVLFSGVGSVTLAGGWTVAVLTALRSRRR